MAHDHLQSIEECPDCASQNIVHGMMRDQIICRDCGLIFEPFAPTVTRPVPAVTRGRAAKAKARRPAKKARRAKAGKTRRR